jgi:hypothetical protein
MYPLPRDAGIYVPSTHSCTPPTPNFTLIFLSTLGHQKGGSFEPVARTILVRIPYGDTIVAERFWLKVVPTTQELGDGGTTQVGVAEMDIGVG